MSSLAATAVGRMGIIGLADGQIVFDGTAEDVTSDVLTQIYGEEDWSTTIRKVDDGDENGGEKAKENGLIRESSAG